MSSSAIKYREILEQFVWRLVPMAQSGSHLIGLGEVIDVLNGFSRDGDEHEIDINVGLTLGFRLKSDGIVTGALYTVRVSNEGIEFDVTELYYDSKTGSDNSGHPAGFIGWNGSVRGEPMDWFEGAQALIGDSDASISVERDHI